MSYHRNYRKNSSFNKGQKNKFNKPLSYKNGRERIVTVQNQLNEEDTEEYIANLMFELMYGLAENEFNKVVLRSQGKAINVCAQIVTAFEKRLEEQMIPIKRNITINSKFLPPKKRKVTKKTNKRQFYDPNMFNLISYFDVVYYF
ncbi:MAG: hypothetical protein ACTSRZ_05130 [Promethearchaeota archaeon]